MGDLDTNYIAYFFAGLCKYRNLVLPAAPTPRANGHGSCGRITPDAENCVHYTSRRAFRRGSPVPGNNPAGCGSGGNRSPGRGLRPKPPRCRSQIESSYSQPSRKFRFSDRVAGPDDNVRIASPGSRPAGLSKAEATGLAPKQSANALL